MGLERDKFIFQQDNDPKHTAWLGKSVVQHQANSQSSTEPIENLWAHL